VHIRILPAAAMPHVYGILHHGKPILLQVLAELGVILPVLFGFGGQIKKYKNPQDLILV